MSWYDHARLWLMGGPESRALALGAVGIALAVALGLGMTAVDFSPRAAGAPGPVAARKLCTVGGENAPLMAEGDGGSGRTVPEANAVNETQAVLEQKNNCLRRLIALHQERRQIMQRLEAEHPALREIPPLLKWLGEMPVKQFPTGAQQWQALLKNDPVMNQRFFELMVLNNAGVWMALLTDPKYGAWYAEVFVTARLSASATHDLQVLDATTDFKGAATARPTTPAEVVSAYALRAPAYGEALQSKAQAWGLQISAEMDDYLEAMAQQRVMRTFLRQYQESLTPDALKQVQSGIGAQQAQFMDLPATVKVEAELMARLRQAADE